MFQTPAAGGNCSGDGSGAGSGPVDVVGTVGHFMKHLDGLNRPYACGETYTLEL